MNKIYIAGAFQDIEKINERATELRSFGYVVDCRWLQGLHQVHPGATAVEAATETMPPEAQTFALDDVEDLFSAEIFLLFTEKPYARPMRGGRFVELGMAIAWHKRIWLIGPRENVFCCLPGLEVFKDWETFKREKLNQ